MKNTVFILLSMLGALLLTTQVYSQSFPIEKGTDVTLDPNSGYLRLGNTNGLNIVMDENEIQARHNGAVSPLTLNNEGGNIHIVDYTRLGANGPSVKTKLITGTTVSNQVTIDHGLADGKKIISATLQYNVVGGLGEFWVPVDEERILGINTEFILLETALPVGRPYRAFIFYIP